MAQTDTRKQEQFFMDNLNPDNIFKAVERVDFVYLYHINRAQKEHSGKVYLSTIVEDMHQPMSMVSRGMERLQDKGYISWKVDDSAGKTYVEVTTKAVEMLADQKKTLDTIYNHLKEIYSDEELALVSSVMKEARKIATELNE